MQKPTMTSMIYDWESGSFDLGVLGSCWMMYEGDGVG